MLKMAFLVVAFAQAALSSELSGPRLFEMLMKGRDTDNYGFTVETSRWKLLNLFAKMIRIGYKALGGLSKSAKSTARCMQS
jgi:hypothetical protein